MYDLINKNIKSIEIGINEVQRAINQSIKNNNEMAEKLYTKILAHLIVSWAENRIYKLIYEQGHFQQTEIDIIIGIKQLMGKWESVLQLVFNRAFSPTNVEIKIKYDNLLNTLRNDFDAPIQLRNRLAHGQWEHAFNVKYKSENIALTNKINSLDIVTLDLLYKKIRIIASIIHDLAVSPTTYIRDFDSNYQKYEIIHYNKNKRTYQKHIKAIKKRKTTKI